jgi:NitT/TauT family transport system substrate-binding protein
MAGRTFVGVIVWLLLSAAVRADPIMVAVNGDFDPFDVAQVQGLYADEQLDVKIVRGELGTDTVPEVIGGKVDIALGDAGQLVMARAGGARIRAIAALMQHSQIAFLTPTQTGITRPAQFAGRRIRVNPTDRPELHALLALAGVPPGSWTEVTLPPDPNLFVAGAADVWDSSVTGMALALKARGIPFNTIYPDDYRIHGYSQVLFANEAYIANHRTELAHFLHATIKAERWTLEHPDEAAAIIAQYDPRTDVAAQIRRIVATTPLVYTGDTPIGSMRLADWQTTIAGLGKLGTGPGQVTPEEIADLDPLARADAMDQR